MAKNNSPELFDSGSDTDQGPVECLGMTFPNDQARREYFLKKLREKLKDPEFRQIEGFPIGEDEDILALSDPPYYTACPNPFMNDFIEQGSAGHDADTAISNGTTPFVADVAEGKNEALYNVHPYHTKVPHKAIMRYILHYTKPGDIVFDGFCGSGMTGVAAQLCADIPELQSLGFTVINNGEIHDNKVHVSHVGRRRAILCDLAPAATFIASNLNDASSIARQLDGISAAIDDAEEECGWMYKTRVRNGECTLMYTVWSDVYICNNCGEEVIFWQPGVGSEKMPIESPNCAHCDAVLSKRDAKKVFETYSDPVTRTPMRRVKRVPVMINVKDSARNRFDKLPDQNDIELIRRIETAPLQASYPTDALNKGERYYKDGLHLIDLQRVDQFFTSRSLNAICAFLECCEKRNVEQGGLFAVTSVLCKTASLMHNIGLKKGRINLAGALPNVMYIPSTIAERNIFELLRGRLADLRRAFSNSILRRSATCISTGDVARQIAMPDNSVDYIFVDPPFGHNLMYSELNEIWEAWLRVRTACIPEAVISKSQKKDLLHYQSLMKRCFAEFFRVLKPGKWLTVEFHNSKNSVWNTIQEALSAVGFVVAAVRVLDKGQGTRNQMTQVGAVNKDLIISAYKPDSEFQEKFRQDVGSEESGWDFVRSHLRRLPVFVPRNGQGSVIPERQKVLLFDRMVAYHVQQSIPVPMSAAEFYGGLRQRFPERDGMYFLNDQVSEYDRERLSVERCEQLELFVSDEKSAIQWVSSELSRQPMSFGELQPIYMQEAQRAWEKHEAPIELETILRENFVEDEDHKWHVPDPSKESHLEQLRNRALLKEFQQYLESKGKIRVVRTEALRAGFKECWQQKDYKTILAMSKRVAEEVIAEDEMLLLYMDNAQTMAGE